ncbi:Mitochondrial import inner membrane translocase subunit TIM22-1 [Platanthera guangdongensis]|uniref:Mitochondrial import inner membrane translocase subunit TIM22-1 n=1 Tax=Platanthera guangdongensis TaxID=2320717 RepID=A0ABR2M8H0_9ASPA
MMSFCYWSRIVSLFATERESWPGVKEVDLWWRRRDAVAATIIPITFDPTDLVLGEWERGKVERLLRRGNYSPPSTHRPFPNPANYLRSLLGISGAAGFRKQTFGSSCKLLRSVAHSFMASPDGKNQSELNPVENPRIEPLVLPTLEEIRGQDIWNNCGVRTVVSGIMDGTTPAVRRPLIGLSLGETQFTDKKMARTVNRLFLPKDAERNDKNTKESSLGGSRLT